MYQAKIFFETVEDNFNEGETGKISASWDYTLKADTPERLRELIAQHTYSEWDGQGIHQDDINDYPDATEYWADYMTGESNDGEATQQQIEAWKRGELRLWAVHCHILVSEIIKKKATI